MSGRYVTVAGMGRIWMPCDPSTPVIVLIRQAREILNAAHEMRK